MRVPNFARFTLARTQIYHESKLGIIWLILLANCSIYCYNKFCVYIHSVFISCSVFDIYRINPRQIFYLLPSKLLLLISIRSLLRIKSKCLNSSANRKKKKKNAQFITGGISIGVAKLAKSATRPQNSNCKASTTILPASSRKTCPAHTVASENQMRRARKFNAERRTRGRRRCGNFGKLAI